MQGYIIEGVIGAGKSSLLSAIEKEIGERFSGTTRVVLTEHYTDRLFENERREGTATFTQGLEHCEEIARHLVWLADIKYSSKFSDVGGRAAVSVLIERFVGTQVAHHVVDRDLDHEETNRCESLLRSLAEVGIESVVLEVEPSVLAESIRSTREHRPESWSNYLDSIGNEDEVLEYFTAWQDRLLSFYDGRDVDHERIVIESVDSAGALSEHARELVARWD